MFPDAVEKPNDKTKELSKFDNILRKKSNFEEPKQPSLSNNTKEDEKKLSVSVLRTRNPENEGSHAERTTRVENKRVSEGGTEYEEVNTTTTKINRSARGSKYYEKDKTTQRRVATKSGSEFNELDVTIEKDGYSASQDKDVQETAKAQILLTKTLGQAMRGLPFFRSIAPPQSNDLTKSASNQSLPNSTGYNSTKVEKTELEGGSCDSQLPPVSACPEARLRGMTDKLQEISYIGPRPTGRSDRSSSDDDNVFQPTQQFEFEAENHKPVLAFVQVPDTYKGDAVDKDSLAEIQKLTSPTPKIEKVDVGEPQPVTLMTEVIPSKETVELHAYEESDHQEDDKDEDLNNGNMNKEFDSNGKSTEQVSEKDENQNIEDKSVIKLDQDTASDEDEKEGIEDEKIAQTQLQIEDARLKGM